MNGPGKMGSGHVFISYVHDDDALVERLTAELTAGGIDVWRDKDRLALGEHWEMSVRKAIEEGTFFIACFSRQSALREKSYMNEELSVAIDELRKRPRDSAWFISVLLSPDSLPNISIDASRTLASLHYLKLYEDWPGGVKRLITDLTRDGKPEAPQGESERSDLKRPVSAAYLTRRDLFESAVDATLEIGSPSASPDAIRRLLGTRNALPATSLYATPGGAENWIRWCQDPANSEYHDAVRFWAGAAGREVTRSIADLLGRGDFDYVSFGPGDGTKDALLIDRWLEAEMEITYYPFDASLPLLTRGIQNLLRQISPGLRERLYVKAVLAEFGHATAVDMVFAQRSSPNVIAVLGNSLSGLGDELRLLGHIRERMGPDDLLVLEAPLQSEGTTELWETGAAFYFEPLASVGVRFDPAKISIATVPNVSPIPETISTVVSYRDMELDGRRYEDVPLGLIRRYTEGGLLEALQGVGYEILSSRRGHLSSGPIACVARRAPADAS